MSERELPPFSGDDPKCIKCGNYGAYTRWIPPSAMSQYGNRGECLERECRRCDYVWAEAIVDRYQI